jgi:hypothetical protein
MPRNDQVEAEKSLGAPSVGSEEAIALAALRQYNPAVDNPNVFTKIPKFFGGTLYLVEFGPEGSEKDEWSVLVKGGRAIVWYDYEQALQFAASARSTIQELTSASTVIGLVSIIVVVATIVIYVIKGSVEEPFRAALASVLGFWFGQVLPRREA